MMEALRRLWRRSPWPGPLAALVAFGSGLGLGRRGRPTQAAAAEEEAAAAAAAAAAPSPGSVEAGGELALLSKYGLPGLAQLRTRSGYALAYDPRLRGPWWVLERLEPDSLRGPAQRSLCRFRPDPSLPRLHRASNQDFQGSGFQRGHLAAAANHRRSQEGMEQTFLLSNVAPQNPHLNQNAWNNLEKYCRSLTKYNKNVYVCTGPLFLPRMEADGKMYVKYQVIGENHVAVPTHFFKVLILEKPAGEIELHSYVMPNAPVDETIPLERFLVPIESIERASGLLFVSNILKRTNNLKTITAGNQS